MGSASVETEDGEAPEARGGLDALFTMILGGLVGSTPHMISASVIALARLVYEFAPQLAVAARQLLPVVLSLLRSRSREVIKSVLGFVKVSSLGGPVVEQSYSLPCKNGLFRSETLET